MGMLSDAFAWLGETLTDTDVAGLSVTYTRLPNKTCTLNMVPGRPDAQRREPGASRVKLDDEIVAFHFQPGDLLFSAVQVNPERGDRLTIGSVVREVMPGDGGPAWSRSDVYGKLIMVRTKRVSG